jgi:phenylacetate-coenzyme A ligase PaaK-like adenylate-forming protein
MSQSEARKLLDPAKPGEWAFQKAEDLFELPRKEVEELQLEAIANRFESLRSAVPALEKLAERQGVDRIEAFAGALPVFFDHTVYKSYPLSLIEKRQFERLMTWFQRLTTHDLSQVSLEGVRTVDDWLTRLDEHGMIIGHSTGTTGKLSFIPRSQTEWPAWKAAFFDAYRIECGIDLSTEVVPVFATQYRTGHHMMAKMMHLFAEASAGGEENRHVLYDYPVSSDLMSLAGRLQAAEERGELDQLDIDPKLCEDRKEFIERSRHRDEDLELWFSKLVEEFRGQKVMIRGTAQDLVRLSMKARDRGLTCEFAPGSVLIMGGGMKGFKDAPDDWEDIVKHFTGIDRISSCYGMSEIMGLAPKCSEELYHFLPYTVPFLLDENGEALPREGTQVGRMALFDLLAETYWGGFVSGDRITIHWDEHCACGWRAPRIERQITRFSELEGGDDKITCAGSGQAYSELMDYVGNI